MVLFWSLGSGVPVAGIVAVAILSLTRGNVSLTKLAVIMLVLGGVVLVFGLLVTVLNARAVVAPIQSVRTALHRVDEGDLDVEVPVYDGTQIGLLQAGFNQMVSGLRDRERIRDLFGMHVGHEVAQAAVQADTELGGQTRTVTVLLTDLIGSTQMATNTPPAEVVDLLNRFCSVVVEEVDQRRGLVNKFMGDAVLAIFGAPVGLDDHAGAALAAARAIAQRLRTEVPECDAGIGVATGEVVAGNVGGEQRFEYTVIGDAVNQAARLTELAKDQPGRVVASAVSVRAAGDEESSHWREGDAVVLRGRDEETLTCVLADEGS
jgi:adenylate cyclase